MAQRSRPQLATRLLLLGVAAGVILLVAAAAAPRVRQRVWALVRGERLDTPAPEIPVQWVAEAPDESVGREPAAGPPPAALVAPEAPEPLAATPPFAIDLAKPVRITWPLDIGPDISPDRSDERLCLRARQGANELLTRGPGDALYAVRLAEPARCRVWFRARYAADGVGITECNNSLLLAVDNRPATLIGNDNVSSRWAWRRGPVVELGEGLHWLRLELREDGVLLDRLALVEADARPQPQRLHGLELATFDRLAGALDPARPQWPIQPVELFALPTRSLVIGEGHANEITVCASWHGVGGKGFEGTVAIHSATAEGVMAKGQRRIACGPARPFARSVVELEFPSSTPRRAHKVTLTVADGAGHVVFRQAVRFVKPFAWAFLGPVAGGSRRASAARMRSGSVIDTSLACERSPMLLARLREPERLGFSGGGLRWKMVADGSCCDWTGAIDLQKVYGHAEHAHAYAVTWLDSRSGVSRRLVSLQADDAAWLWVNGCFLVQMPMELPREGNRLWTSGPLRRGPNPVVVKLTQARHYWGFAFEVVDWHWQGRKGRRDAIAGLEPDQWPGR